MGVEKPETRPRLANLPCAVFAVDDAEHACAAIAAEIAALLISKPSATLGLATGRSPQGIYRELVRRHREEGLSFARASSFNLDEYYGLAPEQPASFHASMRTALFDRVDLPRERAHVPDGLVPLEELEAWCEGYERALRAAGGIDLMILGLGRNGHIGFNEPGSARASRTRLVQLAEGTRAANRADFPPGEAVPERAITMGVATILEARRVRVLAFGSEKAAVVQRVLFDPVGPELPATFLREHGDLELWLDRAAAAELAAAARGSRRA